MPAYGGKLFEEEVIAYSTIAGTDTFFAVRHDEREGEDRRIVLRRATAVTDFDDAVHGSNAVRLDAADKSVVVLLHEVPFDDVIRAAFRAEDQEAVEPGPVTPALTCTA